MHRVVVPEFCHSKEFGPVILRIVAAGSGVLYQGLVLPLSLAGGLPVKGGRELLVDAHVGANSGPESACKLGSTVGDYGISDAMLPDHVLKKHTCSKNILAQKTYVLEKHMCSENIRSQKTYVLEKHTCSKNIHARKTYVPEKHAWEFR